jgi:hypothetical protein
MFRLNVMLAAVLGVAICPFDNFLAKVLFGIIASILVITVSISAEIFFGYEPANSQNVTNDKTDE